MDTIKQFEFKLEQNIQKAISKIFNIQDQNLSDSQILERGNIALMDCANVCMLIAKTIEAKMSIKRFTNLENNIKIPTLEYTSSCKCSCKYSTYYLIRVIKIFELMGDSVTISLNQEYPTTLENEHFKVIIAPRIDN